LSRDSDSLGVILVRKRMRLRLGEVTRTQSMQATAWIPVSSIAISVPPSRERRSVSATHVEGGAARPA
jgi:hypothetical protein